MGIRNQKKRKFLKTFKTLTEAHEDFGLLTMMKEVNRDEKVLRETVMKILNS